MMKRQIDAIAAFMLKHGPELIEDLRSVTSSDHSIHSPAIPRPHLERAAKFAPSLASSNLLLNAICQIQNRVHGNDPLTPDSLWEELPESVRKLLEPQDANHPSWQANSTPSSKSDAGHDSAMYVREARESFPADRSLHASILDALPIQVAVVDRNGIIRAVNKAWTDVSRVGGTAPVHLSQSSVGSNYLDVCESSAATGCLNAQFVADGIRSVLNRVSSEFRQEYQCDCDSEKRSYLLTVTPLVNSDDSVVIAHLDITDRIRAQTELTVERDRFQRLAAVAPGVIQTLTIRPDGTRSFSYANDQIMDIYGATPDALRASASLATQVIHPDDIERVERVVTEAMQAMKVWECEYRVIHPHKGEIWVEGRSTPVLDPDGSVSWHGFLTDITRRKKAEEALRESEARMRLAMSTAPLAIWEWDLESDLIQHSGNYGEVMPHHAPDERFPFEEFSKLIHADDRPRVLDRIQDCLDRDEPYRIEYRIQHADRSTRWIMSHGQVARDASGRPQRIFGVDLDITSHKQLEEQLRQSQKMDAIGRLAGGVAHDFNNLLTVISGYCHVLLAVTTDETCRSALGAIRDAGDHAAQLTKQLLAFSRKSAVTTRLIDLNQLVTNFERLLVRLVGEDISLGLNLAEYVDPIRADASQIEQVLINLVVNARDAMPNGGRLVISTKSTTISETQSAWSVDLKPGRYVELGVMDTGTGISEAVRGKIFDPFFTTKPVGKGTGLGLSVVHGIVKQNLGGIIVESEEGKGTTFRMLFPQTTNRSVEPAEAPTATTSRGTETVLVVEDEAAVRRIARIALESQGYRVLEASHAEEAEDLVGRFNGPIDLLVTDLVMPGMNGRELASKLGSQLRGMRVLYMSGYNEDAVVQMGVYASSDTFLQKPFQPAMLARKVRSILDSPL